MWEESVRRSKGSKVLGEAREGEIQHRWRGLLVEKKDIVVFFLKAEE